MSLNMSRRPGVARPHRSKNTRRAQFSLETLEQRTVLSHLGATAPAFGPMAPASAVVGSVANSVASPTISGFTVNNIAPNSSGQLVANATLTGQVHNRSFSIPAAIPVLSASISTVPSATAALAPAVAAAPVTVLHLQLGAINLSLLGLNVHIGSTPNFGDTAPITVNLVGIPTGSTYTSAFTGQTYQGGFLGDVLAGVGNLLGSGTNGGGLSTLLNQLTSELTGLLNGLLGNASSTPPTATNQHPVLNLPIGPVGLDLLGALVETSAIDVTITATPGPGNLLGNLLG